jgi:hypothetical protein
MKPATIALTGFVLMLPLVPAQAVPVQGQAIVAPSLLEDIACRTVRERVVRPNGRVVHRTIRSCDRWRRNWRAEPRHWRNECRVRHVRTVRPNGRVVYKTVRRCR